MKMLDIKIKSRRYDKLFSLYESDDFVLIFTSPVCKNSDISESNGTLKALEEKKSNKI